MINRAILHSSSSEGWLVLFWSRTTFHFNILRDTIKRNTNPNKDKCNELVDIEFFFKYEDT